ncbi:MAG: DUF559 domain-containing protein [Pseudomonadota bacterium]
MEGRGEPLISNPSPLVGEGGSGARRRGRVRGNADGLTKRQLLPALTSVRSRELRKHSTEAEQCLWNALRRAFPFARFRFQVPFGSFHADFCSHGAKLIIEVDGGQHAIQAEADGARTEFPISEGYRVLRFWNNDVLENIEGVIATIAANLPSPPVGEGGAKRRMRGNEE